MASRPLSLSTTYLLHYQSSKLSLLSLARQLQLHLALAMVPRMGRMGSDGKDGVIYEIAWDVKHTNTPTPLPVLFGWLLS